MTQLSEPWLAAWTARLRELPGPPVLAVYLRGSHAHGAATRHSDVDFDVLVDAPALAGREQGGAESSRRGQGQGDHTHGGGGYERYLAWLEPDDGRMRHVSVAVADVDSFMAEMAEPARWAFGWPVRSPIRPLWTSPDRPDLNLSALTHPPGDPLLEDTIEDLSKIASALEQGNEVWARIAAAELAHEVPTLLRLVNPPRTVTHRRDAWDNALGLTVAPAKYHEDMLCCLGIVPGDGFAAAAHRLVAGTLPLIRPHATQFAKLGDLGAALADGRLDRYVAQLAQDFA